MKKVLLFLVIVLLLAGSGYFVWKQFFTEKPLEQPPIVEIKINKPTEQARTITDEEVKNWPDPGFTRGADGNILTDEDNFLKVLPTTPQN